MGHCRHRGQVMDIVVIDMDMADIDIVVLGNWFIFPLLGPTCQVHLF